MIPAKLIETLFQKYWAILIPVVLVPLFAVALTYKPDRFQSTAIVWASDPVAGESLALGHLNPYLTPAQVQTQVLNDLLGTRSFRIAVGRTAGTIDESASDSRARTIAAEMEITAFTRGTNLVGISAVAGAPEEAQAIVSAVVAEYLKKATAEFDRDTGLSTDYYQQQLTLATEELTSRQAAVASYLASNPKAADPTSTASLNIDYRALVARVDTQRALVSKLTDSLQSVELRHASAPQTQQAAFSVQDPANLPATSLPHPASKTIGVPLAALVFGLLIGGTYLYLSYRADHSIRDAADLQLLQVPLLGSIPDLRAGPSWLARTPIGAVIALRRRDFAKKTAASITTTSVPRSEGAGG